MGKKPEGAIVPSDWKSDPDLKEVVVKRLEAALERGCTHRAAAPAAGISYSSLYNLLKDPQVKERLFNAMLNCRMRIEHKFADDALYGDDWHARADWLKRRAKEDWGDSMDVRKLPDAELLRLYYAAHPDERPEDDLPILDADFAPLDQIEAE